MKHGRKSAKPAQERRPGPMPARIARLRVAADLTQEQLAEAVGVDKTLVSQWERGLGHPSIDRLPTLATVLDTTVSELIDGEKTFATLSQMLEAAAS